MGRGAWIRSCDRISRWQGWLAVAGVFVLVIVVGDRSFPTAEWSKASSPSREYDDDFDDCWPKKLAKKKKKKKLGQAIWEVAPI